MPPRGRPKAPQQIADIVLSIQEITDETVNLMKIGQEIGEDDMGILRWLAGRRLLANSCLCETCNEPMSLNHFQDSVDKFRWYCKDCKQRKSVRAGSFFERSHLPLRQIVTFLYAWSNGWSLKDASREAGFQSLHTQTDWANFCREVCSTYLENNPIELGGIDLNTNEPLVVEIDESVFCKRKYHRGRRRDHTWVLGAIERHSGRCFLVPVADRTANTLNQVILRYILPGSRIISDGWAGYNQVSTLANGVYMHDIVIHEENFVSPNDYEIHTQNVEGMWARVKRKFKYQYGTTRTLFNSYLSEFMWRQEVRSMPADVFHSFLLCVIDLYPL